MVAVCWCGSGFRSGFVLTLNTLVWMNADWLDVAFFTLAMKWGFPVAESLASSKLLSPDDSISGTPCAGSDCINGNEHGMVLFASQSTAISGILSTSKQKHQIGPCC